jgi:RNA polymerase sigma-70 factor (ECF subfamily)
MGNLAGAAEAVVVALAAGGDSDAFDELVRRKQAGVRRLMRRLSNDTALADDLAQHVFVEMWQSLGRLQAPAAFPKWLKTITVNVWLQHFRKRQPFVLDNLAEERLASASVDRGCDSAIDLAKALDVLPPAVRLCVVLAYQERMSHREIAESTGLPLGTVKSHVLRGSARLRKALSDYGGES